MKWTVEDFLRMLPPEPCWYVCSLMMRVPREKNVPGLFEGYQDVKGKWTWKLMLL